MTARERVDLSRCTNDTQREEVQAVLKDGFAIVKVLGSDEPPLPQWAYTVGLWHSYQHPEVLIIGLDHEMTQILLGNVAIRIREKGLSFRDEAVWDDVIEGFDCFFKDIPCDVDVEWMIANCWFYDTNEFPAVQMLWPTVRGVYPWQNEADPFFRWNQPVLSSIPKRFYS